MSKIFLVTLGCVVSIFAAVTALHACGDKFLVGVRGGQYLRYQGPVHPTRILVYWNIDPETDPGDPGDSILEATLKEAGHSVQLVTDSRALYSEVASKGFEIIMMDVADARQEQRRIEGVSPDSTILPVLQFPTRREYSAAKKEFGHAVKTPTTMAKLLAQIEKARPSSR
ncbi:MAG: hypothetical protein V3S30_03280 [Thermoanaerobaculia bacterium]